jgi:hypothetical protein
MARRGTFSGLEAGAVATRKFGALGEIGLTFHRTDFSRPLALKGDGSAFSRILTASLGWRLTAGRLTSFGEYTRGNSAVAWAAGVLLQPSESLHIILAGRSYPGSLVSLTGGGFAEASPASRQRGVYLAADIPLGRTGRLSSYYDVFSPAREGRFASAGKEYLSEWQSPAGRRVTALLLYQCRVTPVPALRISPLAGPVTNSDDVQSLARLRCQLACRLSEFWSIRARAERVILGSEFSPAGEGGFMLWDEVDARPASQWRAGARFTIFQTGSYATRVASLEPDLDGVFSVPELYGAGARWYLLLTFVPASSLAISAKFSELQLDDVKTIGSGLDMVGVNHLGTFGVQIDAQF